MRRGILLAVAVAVAVAALLMLATVGSAMGSPAPLKKATPAPSPAPTATLTPRPRPTPKPTPTLSNTVTYQSFSAPAGEDMIGEVYCNADQIATGGGWEGNVVPGEVTVTNDMPLFGDGPAYEGIGWFVSVTNQTDSPFSFTVYVLCLNTAV